jgi:conjugal transfer mating pair stabilization protein TraG
MQPKKDIDASGLLDTIASVESKGNYNAYFSNAANTSVQFTQMTIAEVQAWQREFIAQGNASSAVGRYQIIDTTLSGLIRQLNLKPTDVFDEATQEKLAVALLERRGLQDYVNKSISKEQFAHNLSMEWAALPKVIGDNPEQSYYQNDGLNRAHLGVSQIFAGIDTLRKK